MASSPALTGRRGGAVLGWSLWSHEQLHLVTTPLAAPVRSLRCGDARLWISQTSGYVSSLDLGTLGGAPGGAGSADKLSGKGSAPARLERRHALAARALAVAADTEGADDLSESVDGLAAVQPPEQPVLFSGGTDRMLLCWRPQLTV